MSNFGVPAFGPSEDGRCIVQFFDARTEYTFSVFAKCLREIGAELGETPDVPVSGYSLDGVWRGQRLTVGYSDDFGCHILTPSRAVAEVVFDQIEAWRGGEE